MRSHTEHAFLGHSTFMGRWRCQVVGKVGGSLNGSHHCMHSLYSVAIVYSPTVYSALSIGMSCAHYPLREHFSLSAAGTRGR